AGCPLPATAAREQAGRRRGTDRVCRHVRNLRRSAIGGWIGTWRLDDRYSDRGCRGGPEPREPRKTFFVWSARPAPSRPAPQRRRAKKNLAPAVGCRGVTRSGPARVPSGAPPVSVSRSQNMRRVRGFLLAVALLAGLFAATVAVFAAPAAPASAAP